MLSVNKILCKDTNEKSADSDIKIPMVAEWFIVFILSVNEILCAATLSVIKILCADTVSVNKHFHNYFKNFYSNLILAFDWLPFIYHSLEKKTKYNYSF